MSSLKRWLVLLAVVLHAGNAWPANGPCWTLVGDWELCARDDDGVRKMGPEISYPYFLTTIEGQLFGHTWSLTEHPDDIARLGDRALWRRLKGELVEDLRSMNQGHRTRILNGVEFIEWQVTAGEKDHFFASAMVHEKEVFITTTSPNELDGISIQDAHEFFMTRVRLQSND